MGTIDNNEHGEIPEQTPDIPTFDSGAVTREVKYDMNTIVERHQWKETSQMLFHKPVRRLSPNIAGTQLSLEGFSESARIDLSLFIRELMKGGVQPELLTHEHIRFAVDEESMRGQVFVSNEIAEKVSREALLDIAENVSERGWTTVQRAIVMGSKIVLSVEVMEE